MTAPPAIAYANVVPAQPVQAPAQAPAPQQPAGGQPGGGPPGGGQPGGGPPGGGQPGGGPPGGGQPGGGPPGGGTTSGGSTASSTPPQYNNGALSGNPPIDFDGDRTKTDDFIHAFELYRMINVTNAKMQNAMARVSLFLSYIKGDKVNDWAQAQTRLLSQRVFGDYQGGQQVNPPTHAHDDEFIWNDMIYEFHQAFAHTARQEDAFIELQKCDMKGKTIDEYIAKFNHLAAKAGWERDARGTLEMFKQGLELGLHRAIFRRETIPRTIDQWQQAARDEKERFRLIQASLGPAGGQNKSSTRQNLFRNLQDVGAHKAPKSRRDPDAMDVDVNVARLSKLTPKERTNSGC